MSKTPQGNDADKKAWAPTNPLADLGLPSPPFWLTAFFILLVVLTWLPLVFIARARAVTSEKPRIHLIQDMDLQPRLGPQDASSIFADRRAMRPRVPGTVPRGELRGDDHYFRGYSITGDRQEDWEVRYYPDYPGSLSLDRAMMSRGQERFNIYCAPCHGFDGYGNGVIHQRAVALEEPRWIPPSSLHTDTVRGREHGHLFNTITNGIRNMAGYGSQISVEDRWAIVLYIRALQRSQHAGVEDVPPALRPSLR